MSRNLTIYMVLLCLMAVLLSACTPESLVTPTPDVSPDIVSPTPLPDAFAFTDETFPRLDGSTANIPLGQALAATMLGKPYEDCEQYVQFNKTSAAYRNLKDNLCDLVLAYEPSPEALQYNDEVELELFPIGRDALVFLNNTANTVNNLTTQQLQEIYRGTLTNWNEVGGPDAEIVPYQRGTGSGSQTLFDKLVLPSEERMEAPASIIIGDMGSLVESVANYDNGAYSIGYNVYFYVTQMKSDPNIEILSIDGVEPSNDSIQTGSYPFVNDFYAVIRKDEPEDSAARLLANWLQTADGKALLDQSGYVSK